jgi:hypothetical protein
LEDLDKANVLEPNHVVTLTISGNVKYMLDDYQGTLEDFDNANVLEANTAFTWKTCGNFKRMLKA